MLMFFWLIHVVVYIQVLHSCCMYCSAYSVVMVVGAGRGPLVEASIKAATSTGRRVRVYAVEKNPGAVNT